MSPPDLRLGSGDERWEPLSAPDEERTGLAERALARVLRRGRRDDPTFADGSGKGRPSVAAWRLGDPGHGSDYDTRALACARIRRERHSSPAHAARDLQHFAARLVLGDTVVRLWRQRVDR